MEASYSIRVLQCQPWSGLPPSIHLCGTFWGFLVGCHTWRQRDNPNFISILPEVGLEDGHLLLGLHFTATAPTWPQCCSFLTLKLFPSAGSSAWAVPWPASAFFFCLWASFLSLQQLLDPLQLTCHGCWALWLHYWPKSALVGWVIYF